MLKQHMRRALIDFAFSETKKNESLNFPNKQTIGMYEESKESGETRIDKTSQTTTNEALRYIVNSV